MIYAILEDLLGEDVAEVVVSYNTLSRELWRKRFDNDVIWLLNGGDLYTEECLTCGMTCRIQAFLDPYNDGDYWPEDRMEYTYFNLCPRCEKGEFKLDVKTKGLTPFIRQVRIN